MNMIYHGPKAYVAESETNVFMMNKAFVIYLTALFGIETCPVQRELKK